MRKHKYTVPGRSTKAGEALEAESAYSEERRQAATRIIFIVLLTPLLAWFTRWKGLPLSPLWPGITLYIVAATAHFTLLKKAPGKLLGVRKIFAIFIDIAITTLIVSVLDVHGFLFSLLYVWIILGNGMRFGPRYLYIAMIFSITGIGVLYFSDLYWHTHTVLVLYLLLATIILPMFMLRLMYRIEENRALLQSILKETEYNAMHDSLTQLGNRYAFNERLQEYIDAGKPFAMFFIDLDGFKAVNDRYGHAVGDRVLEEVAQRLQKIGSETGLALFRLGGDEFALLIPSVDEKRVRALAQRVLESLARPYDDGSIDTISASIGISRCPEESRDASTLKRYADEAMYRAKQRGKNRYELFSQRNMRATSNET